MSKGSIKKNQSVGKLMDIMETMASYGAPIRLNDLSEILNMSQTTVYRFLVTLQDRDYVRKEESTSKYYLTLRLKYFADKIQDSYSLNTVVRPHLEGLAKATGESACLVIMEDDMAVYIDKVDSPSKMVRGLQRIGKRAPLYCTGVGKIFLADMPTETRGSILEEQPIEKLTEHTITRIEDIEVLIQRILDEGVAYDNEECEIGAKCIAAPIKDYSNKVIAAISVTGPTPRMTDDNLKRIKDLLLKTSKEISKIMGYTVE